MYRWIGLVAVTAVWVAVAAAPHAQTAPDSRPEWAYGIAPAGATPPAEVHHEPTAQLRVPGSSRSFTLAQIEDSFGPADWFPEDHPTMPDVVAKGRRPDVRACGSCHYPNGKGRPSNGSVSGLPVAYFTQAVERRPPTSE